MSVQSFVKEQLEKAAAALGGKKGRKSKKEKRAERALLAKHNAIHAKASRR
jgi:hypothetical protein